MSATASEAGTTEILARYLIDASPASLPDPVRHETLRCFLNILGCTVGGARHEAVDILYRTLAPFEGPGRATLVGRGHKSDALTAALINCMSSSIHVFDDTHAEAIVHPAGPVMGAVMAVAEMQIVSGADFVHAFALGVETVCRISKALSVAPAKGNIAWSQTGVAGCLGAAAAAGKLLGLDVAHMRTAIGIAASQAAGIRAMHGTMCTPLMPAQAAQCGLRAALLAREGLTSSQVSIEGRFGLAPTFAEVPDLAAITEGLGQRFEIMSNTYKPYPCGIVIHPIIDACIALHEAHGLTVDRIKSVAVKANPTALTLCGHRRHPADSLLAQVSLHQWSAAALLRGKAGLAEGTQAAVADPAIRALRDRIEAVADASVAPDAAHVTVTLADGRSVVHAIEHGLGSRTNPMTDAQLEAKFRDLATGILTPAATDALIKACWALPSLADAAAVVRAAA